MKNKCKTCGQICYANSQWDSAPWEYKYCGIDCLKEAQNKYVKHICVKYNLTRDQLISLINEIDDCFLEYEYWK